MVRRAISPWHLVLALHVSSWLRDSFLKNILLLEAGVRLECNVTVRVRGFGQTLPSFTACPTRVVKGDTKC